MTMNNESPLDLSVEDTQELADTVGTAIGKVGAKEGVLILKDEEGGTATLTLTPPVDLDDVPEDKEDRFDFGDKDDRDDDVRRSERKSKKGTSSPRQSRAKTSKKGRGRLG